MKMTRDELQAIENHMSNIPAVAGMYTPVLIAWCHALLNDNATAYQRGAEAMREACAVALLADGLVLSRERAANVVRALPTPEEP